MNPYQTINELLPMNGSEDELVQGMIELLDGCAERMCEVGEDEWTTMKEPVESALKALYNAKDACRSVLEALN